MIPGERAARVAALAAAVERLAAAAVRLADLFAAFVEQAQEFARGLAAVAAYRPARPWWAPGTPRGRAA